MLELFNKFFLIFLGAGVIVDYLFLHCFELLINFIQFLWLI